MIDREKCGNCKHWDAGVCRRFPPQVTLWPSDNQQPVIYYPSTYAPDVGAEHPACGEFGRARP
jgi:NAD-dependent dihydropyrimidine dehydrogenase PreA subunit